MPDNRNRLWEYIGECDNVGVGDAHGWIQWKGTSVCMDVWCSCGFHGHVDREFCYFLQCPRCRTRYAVGCNVKLIPLPEDLAQTREWEDFETVEEDQWSRMENADV